MADVFDTRSFTMHALEQLEETCRARSKFITNFVLIFLLLTFWIVVAELIVVDHVRFEFTEDMATGALLDVTSQVSKRTLHRVFETMKQRCEEGLEDVIFASQVLLSGKPFMHRALYLCKSNTPLINPVVLSHGISKATCVDTYKNIETQNKRLYPVSIHSLNQEPHLFIDVAEVCTVMAALDVLNAH